MHVDMCIGFGMEGDSLLEHTRLTAYGLQFAGLGAPLGPTEMQLQDLSPHRWMKSQVMHAKTIGHAAIAPSFDR